MRSTILAGAVAVTFFLAGMGSTVAPAQHSGHGGLAPSFPPTPVIQTGKMKGKIVEVDASSITVETQKAGRTEKVICFIGDRTKTKGELRVGADVVVKYREEQGVRTATTIEVKKAKQQGT